MHSSYHQYSRTQRAMHKMAPGTMGGQSRVATPPSIDRTVPALVEPTPECSAWVLLGTPASQGLTLSSYASAFSFDGESVFFVTGDNSISQRSWSNFNVEIDSLPVDPYGGSFDWVTTGVAVDSAGRLHTIGWTDRGTGTDRIEIWRWTKTSSWGGIRIWNSLSTGIVTPVPSPGSGFIPSIQYSPSNDRIYFHVGYSGPRSVLYYLPASALGSDQAATVMWDSNDLGQEGSPDTQLVRTRDDHIMWVSFPGGNPSRFNSMDIASSSISFIDWDPGSPTYIELGLAHSPSNPNSVVGLDENSFSGSGDASGASILVPSSALSAGEASITELDVPDFPEIRSVAISHVGKKGILWVTRQTLEGGLWYKWECT